MALRKVNAIVVFVHDLDKCRAFYQDVLSLEVTFSDAVSVGFRLGDQDFLLLKTSAAADMVGEAALSADKAAGQRVLLCVGVENVDEVYSAFQAKGVTFIKAPVDQAWGRRTTYFADPEGNLWELFHEL